MRRASHTLLLLMLAGLFLPGVSCSWRGNIFHKQEDTRPLPKVKNSNYSINGKRYRPMGVMEALRYTATGEASVYEGANTRGALGERLPYGAMYAAHTTLPLPSVVRITSVSNGRSCEVRVNDRGPFHRRRIIDVSPAVARKLGFSGVHQVKVEVLSVGDGELQRKRED